MMLLLHLYCHFPVRLFVAVLYAEIVIGSMIMICYTFVFNQWLISML